MWLHFDTFCALIILIRNFLSEEDFECSFSHLRTSNLKKILIMVEDNA